MKSSGETALAGRRVLEISDEKGAWCGKLFADMGADVIRVEVPGGDALRRIPPFWGRAPDPDRGLFFLYTNTSKRSIELDLDDSADRDVLRSLAAGSDLVIESLAPGVLDGLGLGWADLHRINPGLVMTSITGFGQTGPYRDFCTSDIVANALGGTMYVTGEAEDPPVLLAGAQAFVISGANAAASSMIALHHAARSGRGQHVDISLQEVVASMSNITGVGRWLEDDMIPKRMGSGLSASCPSGAFPCKDGRVYLMVNRPLHWKSLAEWIHEVTGNAEVLDPMFEGPSSSRLPYREMLDLFISDLTTQLTVEEAFHQGQRRHIAFTPVSTAASLASDPHLVERGFFVEVDHDGEMLTLPGAPYRHAATPWRIHRRAPHVGEDNAQVRAEAAAGRRGTLSFPLPLRDSRGLPEPEKALSGLRVVEFTAGLAGPWIGRLMAWCGAEVIKVESKAFPDVTRLYVPPKNPELGIQPRLSPWFTDWNAGKKFVSLDLSKPESIALCRELVAKSDVMVENYSTGVLDKLGLGAADLAEVNPRLVRVGSTGYGDAGPYRRFVTWGPNIEAHAGLAELSGFPNRDCTMTQYAYPDPLSALHGLFAVMCALEHRDRSGAGQTINLAQIELTVAAIGERVMEFLANGDEPAKLGNRSMHRAPQGAYPCLGEDRWVALSVADDAAFGRLAKILGEPGLASDPRFASRDARLANAAVLDRSIEAYTSSRRDVDVMVELQSAGIAAGVVQNIEDQFRRDPQLAAHHFFEEIPHAVKGTVIANGIALGLTGTPGRTSHAGSARGQENVDVFQDLLGLDPDEYDRLVRLGAIETFDD